MIYFIQDSGSLAIKIGCTGGNDANHRLRCLQIGNPHRLILLAVLPGDEDEERRLHAQFAEARLMGEWFRPIPDIIRHMLANAVAPGVKTGDLSEQFLLCNAATPGPWVASPAWGDAWMVGRPLPFDDAVTVCTTHDRRLQHNCPQEDLDQARRDAQFIAQARTGWPVAIRRAMAAEEKINGQKS